jgi:hypothetical protein
MEKKIGVLNNCSINLSRLNLFELLKKTEYIQLFEKRSDVDNKYLLDICKFDDDDLYLMKDDFNNFIVSKDYELNNLNPYVVMIYNSEEYNHLFPYASSEVITEKEKLPRWFLDNLCKYINKHLDKFQSEDSDVMDDWHNVRYNLYINNDIELIKELVLMEIEEKNLENLLIHVKEIDHILKLK